ncbi:MAG: homoserine kinase [Gemmatimonadota bacterium]|nr:homoserine kinase [Gemmatimonadota bacterium]
MDRSPSRVSVFAPATISNLGPGFDVLGLALEEPGDVVWVERVAGQGVVSVTVEGDGGRIPVDASRNSASVAAQAVLDLVGAADTGLRVGVKKGLPISAGLGGSAASAVAGAVATNLLLGAGASDELLLRAAIRGEAAGSGAAHADNAAPALLGGLVLVLPGEPLGWVRIPTPAELHVAVARPHLEVETKGARALLPRRVPLEAGIRQWGNAAAFIAACYEGDWDLLARSGVDSVAEGVRKGLVAGFDDVVAAAREAGAATSGLSGSGPSIFALCRGRPTADQAGSSMRRAFRRAGLDSDLVVSAVGKTGARVIEGHS